MAGNHLDPARHGSLGERGAEIRRRRGRGGDARHDLDRHAGGTRSADLFVGAGEDRGIAGLDPDPPLAEPGIADHQPAYFLLPRRRLAGPLADRDQFGVGTCERQNFVTGKVVVKDDVGGAQPLHRAQREQIDVARTAADQGDAAERRRVGRYRGGRRHGRVSSATSTMWKKLPVTRPRRLPFSAVNTPEASRISASGWSWEAP